MTAGRAAALDAQDHLSSFRNEFVIEDALIYLDGNSLGRLPKTTVAALSAAVETEWGEGLVGSWLEMWLALPHTVGNRLAPLVGAAEGEVLISDQTSVNLYKLASAALDSTSGKDILSSESNFPSDLYILEGVARAAGGRLRLVPRSAETAESISAGLDERVGLVSLSHVDYRSGALADLAAITSVAHDRGALALFDLSHSVGVVPVMLGAVGADLAVGCTYKYLNGGPGAPGFLYVRRDLQEELRQPIQGWFGHDDQFGFDQDYRPASGIGRFAVGTPPILSLRGTEAGIRVTARAGLEAIRDKSVQLTSYLTDLFDDHLARQGFALGSPRDPTRRGGHVAVRHPAAWQITQALVDQGVVPDFRSPDVIRFGPAPLYTRFTDVRDAVETVAAIVDSKAYEAYPAQRAAVT